MHLIKLYLICLVFQVFAKRAQDYFNAEGFADLQARRIPKHVSASWISLQNISSQPS